MPLLSWIEIEAIQEGILQNARENVLEVLEVRFEVVQPEVIEAVNQIQDTSLLKQLHREAIAIPSIDEFQQLLQQASETEESTEPTG